MIVSDLAKADLQEATEYYDEQREGLGDEFLEKVDEALRRIDRMPEMHAVVHRGMRRALVDRFPFAVYYRIEEETVVVLAIIHCRRDPKTWRSRG